ncbi:MAG: glutathione S-transferase N-terminal domain-containing protein [Deltaproteobacteria bacterium]|nr:glutathione S-transferase N-terminal domain-containing protein [Deltaproteobacteria bacterium]
MKLFYTSTSPFVRKCLVVAHEVGVAARIETETLRPSPLEPSATLTALNPLNKIPALVTDDGGVLYDSAVICEYLAHLAADATVIPPPGPGRWTTLRRHALADGILEASVLVFYEQLNRPKELWWQPWLDGQRTKALQGLDALEAEARSFGDNFDLGHIAVASTLGWLEFRNVLGELRAARPALFSWYDRVLARPSMQATLPRA